MGDDIYSGSNRRSITWITADYFVDCDFNPDILKGILFEYTINWIVLLPLKGARFSELDFEKLRLLPGISIEFLYWKCRARSPKMLLYYKNLLQIIKRDKADLIYFNDVPVSPYILPMFWLFDKNRTIVAAHDGSVKPSFKMAWITKFVFRIAFKNLKYVNMFSKSQATLFRNNFRKPQIFIIPLALKNFGVSNVVRSDKCVRFLFFGSINSNKNLELLIAASCNLYMKGLRGFKVVIKGYCENWNYYHTKIRFPEIFECDIRLHRNDEIARYFSENHYIVFPYKEMSQSGALKVAFNYNIPVIVSNLDGFTDEVEDGVNGFVFESENVESLAKVMQSRLNNHQTDYCQLLQQLSNFNDSHFSSAIIVAKYLEMFNNVRSSELTVQN